MFVVIEMNKNGSYTFWGYLKRTYYLMSLAEAKKAYCKEARETGWPHSIVFVML